MLNNPKERKQSVGMVTNLICPFATLYIKKKIINQQIRLILSL